MKRYRDLSWRAQEDIKFVSIVVGFCLFFVFIFSLIVGIDSMSRTDIPGTNCEVVETVNRNVWFTPGESSSTEKIVCTETTTIDKIDIEKFKKEAAK